MIEQEGRYVRYEEMECRTGVVEAIFDGSVQVRILREKSCEACASKAHCGAMFGSDTVLEIRTDAAYVKGDRVEIGLNPSAVLSASTLFFVLPVALFFAGLLLGYGVAIPLNLDQQWSGFGLGIVMMAFGFVALKLLTPKLTESQKYEPVITRRVTA